MPSRRSDRGKKLLPQPGEDKRSSRAAKTLIAMAPAAGIAGLALLPVAAALDDAKTVRRENAARAVAEDPVVAAAEEVPASTDASERQKANQSTDSSN